MLSNQDWPVLAVFSDGCRGNDAESSGTRTGETAGGNGSGEILEILKEEYGFSLIEADSCERARQIFESRADFSCVIVFYDEAEGRRDLSVLLQEIFANNEKIPVILFSENLLRGSRTVQFTVNVQKGILLQRRLRQERHTGIFSIIAG